jgi:50S ribosomal protein L16 3-hydroxylase
MESVLQLLGGRTAEDFLAHYWQQQPLLIRQALPGFRSPISADELAGLACEAEVESRLILEKDGPTAWSVEHGPIEETRFSALPPSHWTLLVQECNRYVPELAELLDRFNFIPNWRVDDVMVSYAPDQGSVGPHIDQYDVFLIQGLGSRRWQISTEPVAEDNFLSDVELCIMREFNPSQEWLLQPGDMLYLPPGVAHYGVAQEDCITLSVGFRAPSHSDLLAGYVDHVLATLPQTQRYTDPGLQRQQHPGEIAAEALAQVRNIIRSSLSDDRDLDNWFGQYITEPKAGPAQAEFDEEIGPNLSSEQFLQLYEKHQLLLRSEAARFAYIQQQNDTILYIDGQRFALNDGIAFAAPLLCDQRHYHYEQLHQALRIPAFANFLTDLYNQSYVFLAEADE